MATFTPTTYNRPINPESTGHGEKYSMWRHYGSPIPVGYVVIITGGTANASPGGIGLTADDWAGADSGSGEGGKAIFRGGITYTVTAGEQTILEAAGYTVT